VEVISHVRKQDFPAVARGMFGERDGEALARAAVPPASTTASGWADTFAMTAVGAFLKSLAPQSAAARLFTAAPFVPLDGRAQVSLPRNGTPFPPPVFVAEGAPLPMLQGAFDAETLGPPRKMAYAIGITGGLEQYSAEQATAVMQACMTEASACALDLAVFDTAPDTVRPAGILAGVTALTGTAGGGVAALAGDVRAILAAIADAGGGAKVWLFAHPGDAAALSILAPSFALPVVGTPAIAAGSLVGVEIGAFASGFGALPQIDLAKETTLHFEADAPAPIGTADTPSVVAAPTRSLWQTDALALRGILRAAWIMRAPMSAVVNEITWRTR
jgi:hypothetical protein